MINSKFVELIRPTQQVNVQPLALRKLYNSRLHDHQNQKMKYKPIDSDILTEKVD